MSIISIRTKLILALSLILVLAFLGMSALNYHVSKNSLRKSIIGEALTRDTIFSEIQKDLISPLHVSSLMANDTFLKDWVIDGEKDIDPIIKYLSEIKARYQFFSSFFISEQTGNYYHSDGILKKISRADPHDVWYYEFKNRGVDYDLDVDTNEAAQNTLTIFINHRLNDYEGNLLGVIGVGLNMDNIGYLLDSYRKKYIRNIYLVDPNGIIQVHPNKKLIEKINIFEQEGIGNIAGKILTTDSKPSVFEFNRNGTHILLTVRYIAEFDWFLLVEQDQDMALTDIRKNFIRNLIFGFIITCLIIAINIFTVNYFQGRLEVMATTDKLTGANNRRELDHFFKHAAYLAKRKDIPFCLIIFDIDKFKQINDTLGHLHGDKVLKDAALIAHKQIRKNDYLVRWGGDEFIVLTYNVIDDAKIIAERIRKSIFETDFFLDKTLKDKKRMRISISCGITRYRHGDTLETMVARMDSALYKAKENGRNQTIAEEEENRRTQARRFK